MRAVFRAGAFVALVLLALLSLSCIANGQNSSTYHEKDKIEWQIPEIVVSKDSKKWQYSEIVDHPDGSSEMHDSKEIENSICMFNAYDILLKLLEKGIIDIGFSEKYLITHCGFSEADLNVNSTVLPTGKTKCVSDLDEVYKSISEGKYNAYYKADPSLLWDLMSGDCKLHKFRLMKLIFQRYSKLALEMAWEKNHKYLNEIEKSIFNHHINNDNARAVIDNAIQTGQCDRIFFYAENAKNSIRYAPSDYYFDVGNAHFCLNDFEKASSNYAESHKAEKVAGPQIQRIVESFIIQGRYEEANRFLEEVAHDLPTSIEFSKINYQLGDYQKAKGYLTNYHNTVDLDLDYKLNIEKEIIKLLIALEEYAEALNRISDFLKNELHRKHDYYDVFDVVYFETEHLPSFPGSELFYKKAADYYAKEDYDEAALYYEACLLIDPKDSYCAYDLGTTYIKLNNRRKAIEKLNRSLYLEPETGGNHEVSDLIASLKTSPQPSVIPDMAATRE